MNKGDALVEALTQQEIGKLLNALLEALPAKAMPRAVARLGQTDTAQTVEAILSGSQSAGGSAEGSPRPLSAARLGQMWSGLWQDWDEIVSEASLEEGRYIQQDEHWEPPYFDTLAFVEDMERVAGRMKPLLRDAFGHGLPPVDGFAQAVLEAADAVTGGLPEWMDVPEEFVLGETVTACLLEWEWLKQRSEGHDGFALACDLLDVEEELCGLSLDDDAILEFFTHLPEADQESVYEGMANNREAAPWQGPLQSIHSHWHKLYLHYAETRAPEQYLSSLRSTIPQHWQNGLPVIKALLDEGDHALGLQVIEETLKALKGRYHGGESWALETGLLFPIVSRYYYDGDLSDHKRLLRYYQQAARAVGQAQVVKILEIQRTAFNHASDWEWMLKAFEKTPVPEEVRRRLFQSWCEYTVRDVVPPFSGRSFDPSKDACWVNWLIESVVDDEKGPPWFQEQVDSWLAELPRKRKKAYAVRPATRWRIMEAERDADLVLLRLLTKDLTEIDRRKSPYPTFYRVVVRPEELSSPDDTSRQNYLNACAPKDLMEKVMKHWREHLDALVPNPKEARGSNYTEHARWMAALKELAPQRYQALLENWRKVHKRRRNLWQAMQEVEPG